MPSCLVSKTNSRIDWVDIVKYVCIMMVMVSHLESRTDILKTFYTPFFLTAFFFVSGYVYREPANFKIFISKKIRGLFVPWLIFSVGNILLSQLLSFNEHKSLTEELFWNFMQIRGKEDGVWFVAAIFVTFIPFYFLIRQYQKAWHQHTGMLISTLLLLAFLSNFYVQQANPEWFPWNSTSLPWHLESIFPYLFYMTLGYIFKQKAEAFFDRYNTVPTRVILLVLYLLIIGFPYFSGITLHSITKILHSYLAQLVGITTLIAYCKKIKSNPYLSFVGQNTLIYFALHGKVYSVLQTLLKKLCSGLYADILGNVGASTLFALCFAFILSLILILPAYMINHFFPAIMGKITWKQNWINLCRLFTRRTSWKNNSPKSGL